MRLEAAVQGAISERDNITGSYGPTDEVRGVIVVEGPLTLPDGVSSAVVIRDCTSVRCNNGKCAVQQK